MPRLPETKEEILATGVIDPEFQKVIEAKPLPPGSFYELGDLKDINELSLPWTQKRLAASRPANIAEHERYITLKEGHRLRLLVCYRSDLAPDARCPLIVSFHGGGHCVGNPESQVTVARRLATEHNAVVVLPAYRLAPDHPFPASIQDAWATVRLLAAETQKSAPTLLPSQCDPSRGFIVAGTSAGANLAASVAHLARDEKLAPPLTGQMLVAGTYISPQHVPRRYQSFYLAREQNRDAPVYDLDLSNTFQAAFRPDHRSPLWAVFDQRHPLDQNPDDPEDLGVRHGHMGLPPAYFQICGLDIGRDDSLIYERVLREECGIETKADMYPGYPHVWWSNFPELEASKKRDDDAVAGVGWLLRFSE